MLGLNKLFKKQTNPLISKYMDEAKIETRHTPDLLDLQAKYAHNVFIYNECQDGQPKHSLLQHPCFYRGSGYTDDKNFVMYKKMLGRDTFPLALQATEDQLFGLSTFIGDPGRVVGEVYSVRWQSIVSLDKHALNGVFFERKRIKITIPYCNSEYPLKDNSEMELASVEAWMYIAPQEFWWPQISNENTGKRLFPRSPRLFNTKENIGAYYTFDYKVEAHAP